MKKWAVLFLALLLAPHTAFSQETTSDLGLRIIPFTYSDSDVKSDGITAGLYTYLAIGDYHSLETDIAYTRIGLDDRDDLREWNYTAFYTHYRTHYRFRGGLHFVSSNYSAVDGAVTLGGGIGYERNGRWDAALDGFFTWYNDDSPDLEIYQLTPAIGWYFMKSPDAGLRLQLKGFYIHADADPAFFGGDDDYLSAETELSWYSGSLVLRGFGWAGEQLFPVRENGFERYNLPDLLQGGYGAGLDYILDSGVRLRFETAVDLLDEGGTDADPTLIRFQLVLGRSF